MKNITKITKYCLGKGKFEYRGTFRNKYKFDLYEKVYFTTNRYNSAMLAIGIIVGIQTSVSDNPENLYTIQLTEDCLNEQNPDNETSFKDIICDTIFRTKEEAKQSALEQIKRNFELSKEAIEYFFDNHK